MKIYEEPSKGSETLVAKTNDNSMVMNKQTRQLIVIAAVSYLMGVISFIAVIYVWIDNTPRYW